MAEACTSLSQKNSAMSMPRQLLISFLIYEPAHDRYNQAYFRFLECDNKKGDAVFGTSRLFIPPFKLLHR